MWRGFVDILGPWCDHGSAVGVLACDMQVWVSTTSEPVELHGAIACWFKHGKACLVRKERRVEQGHDAAMPNAASCECKRMKSCYTKDICYCKGCMGQCNVKANDAMAGSNLVVVS